MDFIVFVVKCHFNLIAVLRCHQANKFCGPDKDRVVVGHADSLHVAGGWYLVDHCLRKGRKSELVCIAGHGRSNVEICTTSGCHLGRQQREKGMCKVLVYPVRQVNFWYCRAAGCLYDIRVA